MRDVRRRPNRPGVGTCLRHVSHIPDNQGVVTRLHHGAAYYWSIFPAGLHMRGSVSNLNIRRGQKAPEVRYFYNRRCKPPENQQNSNACKPRRACAVTQPALAKARGLRCRVSRRRALPWLAANLWGRPTVRRLTPPVVEISRVPRLSGAVRYDF